MSIKQQIEKLRYQSRMNDATLEALETIMAEGIPDGFVLEYLKDNEWHQSKFHEVGFMAVDALASPYRLRKLPDPPKPRKVPLTLADVPPGSMFSYSPQLAWLCCDVTGNGFTFVQSGRFVSWKDAQSDRLYIHRPGSDWQLCEKDAE